MSFVCPTCGAESHHPEDAANGYCGRCHAFTGSGSAPSSEATKPEELCECGHERREHTGKVLPTDREAYCTGQVVAVTTIVAGDEYVERATFCMCSSFRAATEFQLREWEEGGRA